MACGKNYVAAINQSFNPFNLLFECEREIRFSPYIAITPNCLGKKSNDGRLRRLTSVGVYLPKIDSINFILALGR